MLRGPTGLPFFTTYRSPWSSNRKIGKSNVRGLGSRSDRVLKAAVEGRSRAWISNPIWRLIVNAKKPGYKYSLSFSVQKAWLQVLENVISLQLAL